MLDKLEALAAKLQDIEIGAEYTLDLLTGNIYESDNIGAEYLLYADEIEPGNWRVSELSMSVQPDNAIVSDTLYAPYNILTLGTLRHHLGDLESRLHEFTKISAQLSIVDSFDCEDCDEHGTTDICDHLIGWNITTVLYI